MSEEGQPAYSPSVSKTHPSMTAPEAQPAAPRVAWRVISRTAMIHNTQRSPSEDGLSCLPSSPEERQEPSRPADVGPLKPVLQSFLAQPNCSTAFALDQQLWTHLAGNNTRSWTISKDCHVVKDGPQYLPLDEARSEIRVLKVSRPLKYGGSTFQANLICVSLDEDPAYLAISYVWGDRSIVGHFESHHRGQGRRIPYNKGILDIINTILACGTTLYLWIDALCINQDDLNERASQVAMMGTIFSKARQVVAFIGEADEMSNTAMEFLLLTANCIWARGSLSGLATAPGLASLLAEIGPAARDWESIKGLISRPFFRRLWIVEGRTWLALDELLLSRPLFCCPAPLLAVC